MVVLTNEGVQKSHGRIVRICRVCDDQKWRGEIARDARVCHACLAKRKPRPCDNCGELAGLDSRMLPRRWCVKPECQVARFQTVGRRSGEIRTRRALTAKTKRCPSCGVVKPRTLEFFGPRGPERNCTLSGWCRSCCAAYDGDRRRTDVQYAERERERLRVRHEAEKQRFKTDPAFAEETRARWRRYKRDAAAREAKATEAEGRPAGYSSTGPQMPVAPLWRAVARFMEDRDLTKGATAAMFGTSERTLWRWEHDGAWVRLEQADAALVAMDMLWFEVWDEAEYPEVAAIWEGEA